MLCPHSHTLRGHPFPTCPIHNMQGKHGRHCSFLDCIHEMAHFCGRNTYFPVTQSRSTNTAFLYSNEYQRIINKACSWTLSLEAEHEQYQSITRWFAIKYTEMMFVLRMHLILLPDMCAGKMPLSYQRNIVISAVFYKIFDSLSYLRGKLDFIENDD